MVAEDLDRPPGLPGQSFEPHDEFAFHGAYRVVGGDQVGCSAAREGDTVCINRSTTSRSDVERRVPTTLRDRLTKPAAVRAFREEYAAEVNRPRAGAAAARSRLEQEATSVTRETDHLIAAISSGMHAERMNDRIAVRAAARRAQGRSGCTLQG